MSGAVDSEFFFVVVVAVRFEFSLFQQDDAANTQSYEELIIRALIKI